MPKCILLTACIGGVRSPRLGLLALLIGLAAGSPTRAQAPTGAAKEPLPPSHPQASGSSLEPAGHPEQKIELRPDVAYAGTDHPRQQLELMLPMERADNPKLPILVFIHGGAWLAGDRRMGREALRPYVQSGRYIGATISYRLSHDDVWPAQIHDCKAAIRWLRAHAADWGGDPERIAVMGPSAGGHLAAMLGVGGDAPELEGDLGPHREVSSRVQCVVDLFGPANLSNMGDYPSQIDHNAPDSPESRLIGGAIPEHREQALAASPVSYVNAGDPPFLIVHGAEDPLVPFPQSEELDAALDRVGVSSILIRVDQGGHGGFRNPQVDQRIGQFLDREMYGVDVEISASPLAAGER